jgi:uncharacterized cupredoxin-like copper-binding protein
MVADGGEDQDWRRTSPHNAMFTGLGAAFVILAIGFVAAWVVSDSGPGASTGGGGHDEMVFGEPGDPATADRVINMEMLDSLAFDPATVEVGAGETVTFRVTNVGSLMHDLSISPSAGRWL